MGRGTCSVAVLESSWWPTVFLIQSNSPPKAGRVMSKRKIAILLVSILILGRTSGVVAQDRDFQQESLRGIQGVHVVVEKVKTEFEQRGLDTDTVKLPRQEPGASWLTMSVAVALCLLFPGAPHRREFPFRPSLCTIRSTRETRCLLWQNRLFAEKEISP